VFGGFGMFGDGSTSGPSRELAPRNTWRRNIFEDCVFDICAGAGEATAEMALEIGTA